jgi:hypothetical protein
MITTAVQGKLVSVSVMGEFTLADYKDFEQQVLHNIEFEGGVYLMLDLRDMVSYTLEALDWLEAEGA